jgi:hypothetical protein
VLNLWENIEIPPERPVVIACPGPGALEGIKRIRWTPGGCVVPTPYIIACNYGVCLPLPRVDEWMMLDERVPDSNWWTRACWAREIKQPRVVISEDLASHMEPWDVPIFLRECLVTEQGSALSYLDPFPQFGTLRSNATVAGAALQRAYWGGARDVYLLGVDMAGSGYFDGSGGVYNRPHNWPYVTTLNALIAVLYAAGMQVTALSPTALDVYQVESGTAGEQESKRVRPEGVLMPLYEYWCEECQMSAEQIAPEPPLGLLCKGCGLPMERVYSPTLHLWDGGYPSKQAQPEGK